MHRNMFMDFIFSSDNHSIALQRLTKRTGGLSVAHLSLIYLNRLLICLSWWILPAHAATHVTIDGEQIIYNGSLTAEANAKVLALYEAATVKPLTLSIRSPGGPIDVGLALGEWVHQQGMNVRVDEFCFSSCANYIFTAGAKKILGKDAVIGFHGGASSNSFNMSQMTATLARIPAQQRDKVREDLEQQLKHYIEANKKREMAFYRAIQVPQKITTLGQEGVYHIYQKTGFRGWYYSLEDMKKLGLKNIKVVGGEWSPERQETRYKIYRVSLENI